MGPRGQAPVGGSLDRPEGSSPALRLHVVWLYGHRVERPQLTLEQLR